MRGEGAILAPDRSPALRDEKPAVGRLFVFAETFPWSVAVA
jgi:hypothetical protein